MGNNKKYSKILVIIVTYNGMKWLERCMGSVANSSVPLDAYIIDNGSTDGSQQFIAANYPQFIFYQSPTNSGFGAANNIGLKYAIENDYDYVYLLNQDAWIEPNTISTLVEQQKLNPEYGILSPLQTNAEKTKLDRNFAAFVSKEMILFSDLILNSLASVYSVNFVMAAHWLISKECLRTVGFFSPIFYHYGEDDNYVHRAKYFKFQVGIVTDVVGVHDREFREMTKKRDVNLLSIVFFIRSSNINHSFCSAAVNAYLRMIWKTIQLIRKYRDLSIIFIPFLFIFKLGKIYRDREINKTPTAL